MALTSFWSATSLRYRIIESRRREWLMVDFLGEMGAALREADYETAVGAFNAMGMAVWHEMGCQSRNAWNPWRPWRMPPLPGQPWPGTVQDVASRDNGK